MAELVLLQTLTGPVIFLSPAGPIQLDQVLLLLHSHDTVLCSALCHDTLSEDQMPAWSAALEHLQQQHCPLALGPQQQVTENGEGKNSQWCTCNTLLAHTKDCSLKIPRYSMPSSSSFVGEFSHEIMHREVHRLMAI